MLWFLLMFLNSNAEVEKVVLTFNESFVQKDLETMLAQFADGSVRIDLFQAHRFGAKPDSELAVQASPLADRWRSVAPIIFASATKYERLVDQMQIQVDGDMAMVWASIRTVSSSETRFTEVYLLKKYPAGWKIAAMSNNRQEK